MPERYTPGTSYTITVRLTHPELARGGFELAARTAEGSNAGWQAGTLSALDARVNVTDTAVTGYGTAQYARHTREATPPRDSVRWTLKWTAPAGETGAVIFHLAANAANDDDSPLGDYVYTATAESRRTP